MPPKQSVTQSYRAMQNGLTEPQKTVSVAQKYREFRLQTVEKSVDKVDNQKRTTAHPALDTSRSVLK